MSGMLNLRDNLQLVNHGFKNGAFSGQELVGQSHLFVLNVPFRLCEKLDAEVLQ